MFSDALMAVSMLANPSIIAILLIGNMIGIVFGLLPGLAGLQAMVLLLPFTFGMDPLLAMYLYAGIMGSTTLGGAVTAILINTPGTPANIATTIDGYPMACRGEATRALTICALSSALGTFVGLIILIIFLPFMGQIILKFRAPEIWWVIVLGLISMAFAVRSSMLKGLISGLFGILLALIGNSLVFGKERFTGGIYYLWDGIDLITFFVGVFALSEIIEYIAKGGSISATPINSLQARQQMKQGVKDVFRYPVTFFRSSIIGTIVGMIPGIGGSVANTFAYTTTVQFAKDKSTFGTGNPEGLVACESSNNAKDGGAMLTTVSFGIPGSPELVILLAAFIIHGIQPGFSLITEHANLVWAIILGLFLSQFISSGWVLLCSRWLARLTTLPVEFIGLTVLVAALAGTYASRESVWDMLIMVLFGILAFVMKHYGYAVITMTIGFVLGGIAENALRQSLQISQGDVSILFTRPISQVIIVLIVVSVLVLPLWGFVSQRFNRSVKNTTSSYEAPIGRQSKKNVANFGDFLFLLMLFGLSLAFFIATLKLRPDMRIFPLIISIALLIALIIVFFTEYIPALHQLRQVSSAGLESFSSNIADTLGQSHFIKLVIVNVAWIGGFTIAIIGLGFMITTPVFLLLYLIWLKKTPLRYAFPYVFGICIALFFGLDHIMRLNLWQGGIIELIPGWLGGEIFPRFW